MNTFNRRISFVVALALSASMPSVAASSELSLAYRGMAIGSPFEGSLAKLRGAFERVPSPILTMPLMLEGFDGIGLARDCPIYAAKGPEANCVRARFMFDRLNGKQYLTSIQVKQSFSPAVPKEVVLRKLEEAYGTPRQRYENEDLAPSAESAGAGDVALIWGGDRVPPSPFRPETSFIFVDYEKIGGRYVTAVVYSERDMVSGLKLVLVDADIQAKLSKEIRAKRDEEEKRRANQNIDSLRF